MIARNLLYKRSVQINQSISVVIPTVGEILDNEEGYYGMASVLAAMPIDNMVLLDSIGVDFAAIDEYQQFLLFFNVLKGMDTSLIFGDLDLSKFELGVNEENGKVMLIDSDNDIRIDEEIHRGIAETLRKILHIEKNTKKPANKEARDYMLERAKKKMKRKRNKPDDSHLESLIVAMVNTEQFKYKFDEVRDLTIYQFNESVRQIIKKVDYDNQMTGVYSGTIDAKSLGQDDLNWLIH